MIDLGLILGVLFVCLCVSMYKHGCHDMHVEGPGTSWVSVFFLHRVVPGLTPSHQAGQQASSSTAPGASSWRLVLLLPQPAFLLSCIGPWPTCQASGDLSHSPCPRAPKSEAQSSVHRREQSPPRTLPRFLHGFVCEALLLSAPGVCL